MSILIVEDDPSFSEVLVLTLSHLGHSCVCAANGIEAAGMFARGMTDLVLTDYGMPGMDGLELIGKLKTARPNVPVLFMTATHSDELLLGVLKFPRVLAMKKPFDLMTLVRAMEKVFELPAHTHKPQRKHLRVPIALDVEIEKFGKGRLTNLSLGGTFVETTAQLPVGAPVSVRFSPSIECPFPFGVRGTVLWRSQQDPGYGMQFHEISAEIEANLRGLVVRELARAKMHWFQADGV